MAQNRFSGWQDYLSYMNAHKVAFAEGRIFCATGGGLFFFDSDDNSIRKLSRTDGLSEVGISTIAYNHAKEVLIVAYINGNIDLVWRNRIINLADIERKQASFDKTIHNIFFHGDDAYLACGFGIVVINLGRNEVRDTYIIGDNGDNVAVYDVEVHGQKLYAATARGVMSANLQNTNLLDYRNWHREANIPGQTSKFSHLGSFRGELLAVRTADQWSGDEVYVFRSGQWIREFTSVGYVHDLQVRGDYLVISDREEVILFDKFGQVVGRIRDYPLNSQPGIRANPRSAGISGDGSIWIADNMSGLIRIKDGKFELNVPSGPLNNSVFSLTVHDQSVWVASGGRTDPWNNQFKAPVFQQYTAGAWNHFSPGNFPEMTGFYDIVQVAVNPSDPGHVFAASWGGGVLEFRNNTLVNRYNNLNSPLETAIPGQPSEPYTRIGGIAFDSKNTLWITNAQSSMGLHALTPGGEWNSHQLTEVAGFQYMIGQVMVTRNDDKWIIVPRGRDVYVVNKDGTRKRYLPVTSYFFNGQQEIYNRMNDVYSMAEDLNGDIWVGTSRGVAVFPNAHRIWQDQDYYAYQPGLELGDGLYHPLLEGETITAIAVDGANRKWLGTKNSGLYLVSEKGDRELLHFTSSNSPLLTNNITSLGIVKKTGLVFIGTDAGLISFQGDAPEGEGSLAGMYVFPNPVRETYDGPVTITGLMRNSDVRITDIAGNLVHKTKSLGNQVIWDGKNLNGRRVSTGVYLIFASDGSGEQTQIIKLLFIN